MTDLPPGRELDSLIAEKVMGWIKVGDKWKMDKIGDGSLYDDVPHYSTDIATAWKVVEMSHFDAWMVGRSSDGNWQVWNPYTDTEVSRSESAPHAICLAALKAVGKE